MSNSIAYTEAYLNLLDQIYAANTATAILEMSKNAVRFSGENSKTVYMQELTVEGLGTYSRSAGYVSGDADVAWTAYTLAQDRGKKFILDALDKEQALIEIMQIAAEFQRTKVTSEVDAYRFEKICTLCSLDVSADLTYDTAIEALDTGIETLDDAEVPVDSRVLFVSNNYYKLMKQSGEWFNVRTAKERIIDREIETFDGMRIIRVPKNRFYNNFDFSATDGFTIASGAKQINFMIADKNAIAAVMKYENPKIVDPKYNSDADAWVYGYRCFHDLFIPTNKKSGVYIHAESTTY